tara:strand:+ start:1489 stop:1659 length:171 start_codon:yes stop_codon:yes gene_type:complete
MKYSFLTLFVLLGCPHRADITEEAPSHDYLDILSEDDLEGLPESGDNEELGESDDD